MQPLRILLADDNAQFVASVRRYLARLQGIEVVGRAEDGERAMALARELQPDLLLLDIAMPGVDGLEAARQMQAWPRPPLIVFLSMNDSAAYREEARRLGAVAFVSKADFVDELTPVLERLAAAR